MPRLQSQEKDIDQMIQADKQANRNKTQLDQMIRADKQANRSQQKLRDGTLQTDKQVFQQSKSISRQQSSSNRKVSPQSQPKKYNGLTLTRMFKKKANQRQIISQEKVQEQYQKQLYQEPVKLFNKLRLFNISVQEGPIQNQYEISIDNFPEHKLRFQICPSKKQKGFVGLVIYLGELKKINVNILQSLFLSMFYITMDMVYISLSDRSYLISKVYVYYENNELRPLLHFFNFVKDISYPAFYKLSLPLHREDLKDMIYLMLMGETPKKSWQQVQEICQECDQQVYNITSIDRTKTGVSLWSKIRGWY